MPCKGHVGPGHSGEHILEMNLDQYLPVLLFISVGIAVGVVPLVLGYILGPNRPDAAKNSPYECGFEAFEDARMKFDVRYYLVAILFIVFDLEIAFVFPWALVFRELGVFGLIEMGVFLALLLIAALALKLRAMAKVAHASSGPRRCETDVARVTGMAPWQVERARADLRGWELEGIATSLLALAEADAAAKGLSRDPVYAVERAVLVVVGSRR